MFDQHFLTRPFNITVQPRLRNVCRARANPPMPLNRSMYVDIHKLWDDIRNYITEIWFQSAYMSEFKLPWRNLGESLDFAMTSVDFATANKHKRHWRNNLKKNSGQLKRYAKSRYNPFVVTKRLDHMLRNSKSQGLGYSWLSGSGSGSLSHVLARAQRHTAVTRVYLGILARWARPKTSKLHEYFD